MLFKNLKSGNYVEAKDAGTVDLMKGSPTYEAVVITTPAEDKPVKKPAGKAKK